MQTRPLGNSGLATGPLVLGAITFGWTTDEAVSHGLLDAFVAGGFNAIDTADLYSDWGPGKTGGESEEIIGRWLKARGRRDDVLILTKVGMWKQQPGLSAANIASAAEASLKRLQTDYIDLYQSHQDDADTPPDETLEAYGRLIKAGKVRAIGASNFTADRLQTSLDLAKSKGLPRYEVLQPNYNLYDRAGFEAELEGVCLREGLGVIPYFSLAAGFLSGKYRTAADLEGQARRFVVNRYLNDRGLRILAALDTVSEQVGAPQSQVALAWLLARPAVTALLASATSIPQLEGLIAATRLDLPADAVAALDQASDGTD